jgi:hypothetical protein
MWSAAGKNVFCCWKKCGLLLVRMWAAAAGNSASWNAQVQVLLSTWGHCQSCALKMF